MFPLAVMFVGGVVAATVELINSDSSPVHEYGAYTRWIVMYPLVMIALTKYSQFTKLKFLNGEPGYFTICPLPPKKNIPVL